MRKKAVIAGVCTGCILLIAAALVFSGVAVLDCSAQYRGDRIYWNDAVYVPCSGEYHEGRAIAATSDGWKIHEVEEDSTHTFIVVRSFLDQALYVREDYDISEDGEVSAVFWNKKKITDGELCAAVADIVGSAETDFEYETIGISVQNDTQRMKSLYLCHDGCPVGTDYAGYMGTLNGQWVITTDISPAKTAPDGSSVYYVVSCSKIPERYIEVLKKYFT